MEAELVRQRIRYVLEAGDLLPRPRGWVIRPALFAALLVIAVVAGVALAQV